ncbi:MAG TPA: sigma-70 family RNA polymerase sigma factor [Arachnia sp.]|nr:sigma-70 family RNA polymerase sigma factor [Arachnia sp.]
MPDDSDHGSTGAREDARRAVDAVGRDGFTRILATLARRFGDLDLAEDALQEAVAEALRTWPGAGVPRVPEAWLTTAAKRKALDSIRRDGVLAQKLAMLRVYESRAPVPATLQDPAEIASEEDRMPDERLGLCFACAHPALKPEDRVAMTLRFVAGLSAAEVAHALLVPVPTMQQRLTRAKRRVRTLGIPFDVPRRGELDGRVAGVLRVVYLLYAEGFARSGGEVHVRDDLTAEAIRLAHLLRRLLPTAETVGLLALLLLTEARRPARTGAEGRPVPLADQDRGLWDRALIAEGVALAEEAASGAEAGGYAIQAAIAALHAEAPRFESTDWTQIAVLYGMLERLEPGPVVRLARAVALGRALGLEEGLRRLDLLAADPVLGRLRAFHVARGVTLEELGRDDEAADAYRIALSVPGNRAEDDFLIATLEVLDERG